MSTSGGIGIFGEHSIKIHSQTQETIALSSGEPVCVTTSLAAVVGLGAKGLLNDMRINVNGQGRFYCGEKDFVKERSREVQAYRCERVVDSRTSSERRVGE